MAVAFDQAFSSAQRLTAGNNVSLAGTVANNPNRYMVIGASMHCDAANTSNILTSLSWHGQACTRLKQDNFGAQTVELWGLVAPDVGSFTLDTVNDGHGWDSIIGAQVFYNVDQSTPTGTAVSAHFTASFNPSITLVSAVDGMCADVMTTQKAHSETVTGSGQVANWSLDAPGFVRGAGSYSPGGASVVMSWSSTASDGWSQAGVPLIAAATVGVIAIPPSRTRVNQWAYGDL